MKNTGSKLTTLLVVAAFCLSAIAAWLTLRSYLASVPSLVAPADPLVVKARQDRSALQVRNDSGKVIGTLISDGDKWRFVTLFAQEAVVEDSEITLAGNVAAVSVSVVERAKPIMRGEIQ